MTATDNSIPTCLPVGNGFIPVIYYPDRKVGWLRLEQFARKAKASKQEAIAYAARTLLFRGIRKRIKERKLAILSHPRFGGWE